MGLNVVLLGPPASGKGTQAVRLAQARRIPNISTGDILREAAASGSHLGLRAAALINRGELLGDDEMIGIVKERLAQPDAARGFILDGFPRRVAQAEALERMMPSEPLVAVDLVVPEAELLRRMRTRRVCSRCAAVPEPGQHARDLCARCGGSMMRRADDGDENVRQHRLKVYARESKPLLEFYGERPTFQSINGAQTPEEVSRAIEAVIDSMAHTKPASSATGSHRGL